EPARLLELAVRVAAVVIGGVAVIALLEAIDANRAVGLHHALHGIGNAVAAHLRRGARRRAAIAVERVAVVAHLAGIPASVAAAKRPAHAIAALAVGLRIARRAVGHAATGADLLGRGTHGGRGIRQHHALGRARTQRAVRARDRARAHARAE